MSALKQPEGRPARGGLAVAPKTKREAAVVTPLRAAASASGPAQSQTAQAGSGQDFAARPAGATQPAAPAQTGDASRQAAANAETSQTRPPGPRPVDGASAAPARAGLELLLALDEGLRGLASERELWHFAANETRKLTGARQIFVIKRRHARRYRVEAISSMAAVDKDTPLVRMIERGIDRLANTGAIETSCALTPEDLSDAGGAEAQSYPFRFLHWQPLTGHDGAVIGGLLQAREGSWSEANARITARQAQLYVHALAALKGRAQVKPRRAWRRWALRGLALAAVLALALPVPLTTLAPAEVVAHDPFVVAAPIEGVIETIVAKPNTVVKAGDVLFRFDDTTLRNKHELAVQEVRVAQARHRRLQQAAIFDKQARHELPIVRAELALKQAEQAYAQDLLSKAVVRAPRDGLLIFPGADRWKGRPVATGEQIMRIADPQRVRVKIDLPVADAIVLQNGAKVRLFLDSNPLQARDAHITRGAYQAERQGADRLIYDLRARFDQPRSLAKPSTPPADTVRKPTGIDNASATAPSPAANPRIGARGTAQVFGETVPLAFFLLRRPLAATRQYLGL